MRLGNHKTRDTFSSKRNWEECSLNTPCPLTHLRRCQQYDTRTVLSCVCILCKCGRALPTCPRLHRLIALHASVEVVLRRRRRTTCKSKTKISTKSTKMIENLLLFSGRVGLISHSMGCRVGAGRHFWLARTNTSTTHRRKNNTRIQSEKRRITCCLSIVLC